MQPHVGVCFSWDLLFGVAIGAPTAASLPGVAGQRLGPHRAPALEARVLERRRRQDEGGPLGRLWFPHQVEAAGAGFQGAVTCQATLRKQEAAKMLGPGSEDR